MKLAQILSTRSDLLTPEWTGELERLQSHVAPLSWDGVREQTPNHVGGTMRPIRGFPDFNSYHIGFEEYFGGYNFGTGNAQVDFKDMKFDWAQ